MIIPSWVQALVLGIVQGLTEFIPVSSSGHVVLLPYLFGWERPGLAFDVALHFGTAGAIVVYFRSELVAMARGVLLGSRSPEGRLYRRVFLLIALGSVPVAVVGFLAKDFFEEVFATPVAAAGFLFVTALILFGGEAWRTRRVRRSGHRRGHDAPEGPVWTGDWMGRAAANATVSDLTLPVGEDPADPDALALDRVGVREAILVGIAQVLALFPGVSRSGTTIMAGVLAGMTREAATRFSFLLALPALLGASALSLPDLGRPDVYAGWEIGLAVLASFVAGYGAIRFLIALVSTDRLTGFARYCVVAGVVGLLGYAMIGPPGSA